MPKRPIVLLHGALGSSSQLEPLATALGHDRDVHRLDFEGHGPRRAIRPYRIESFVENVLEFLDERSIPTARLFGYSMGGYVALQLALAHPERVSDVTTLGTKFRWDPQTAAKEASRLNPDVIRAKVPHFAEVLAARHARGDGWERVVTATAELLTHLGNHPLLTDATLARITQPVRVIVGDRDNTVSVDESTGAAAALRNGSLTVMESTAHPIEQVDVSALAALLR